MSFGLPRLTRRLPDCWCRWPRRSFPSVLFSWFYECTPQGLQLESEIPANESIARHTGQKLDRWLIAILLRAVVLLLTDKLVLRPNEKPEASAIREKSIAVLLFDNLSHDPENAYLATAAFRRKS